MRMKKTWLAPIVFLILMALLIGWSTMRIYTATRTEDLPGGLLRLASLLIGTIITVCIVFISTLNELKIEKMPAEEKAPEAEEEKPAPEVVPVTPSAEAVEKPVEKPIEKPAEEVVEEKEPSTEEEMVVCGGCGALVPASSKQCPNCGAEFEE